MNLHPKLIAAGTGGSLGGAFTVLLVWVLGLHGVTVPNEVAQALTIIFSTAAALAAGYIQPSGANASENPIQAPQAGQKE